MDSTPESRRSEDLPGSASAACAVSTDSKGDPGQGLLQAALEDFEIGVEVGDLADPFGARLVAGLRYEADELAVFDGGAVAVGEFEDAGVDLGHRGGAVVGDVHADLGAAISQDTEGFDSVQTSVGGADVAGDGACGGDVRLLQMHVIGDEEAAGSDGAGSGGLVGFGAADVGAAGGAAAGGGAGGLETAPGEGCHPGRAGG